MICNTDDLPLFGILSYWQCHKHSSLAAFILPIESGMQHQYIWFSFKKLNYTNLCSKEHLLLYLSPAFVLVIVKYLLAIVPRRWCWSKFSAEFWHNICNIPLRFGVLNMSVHWCKDTSRSSVKSIHSQHFIRERVSFARHGHNGGSFPPCGWEY